jgi:hypothetical protein
MAAERHLYHDIWHWFEATGTDNHQALLIRCTSSGRSLFMTIFDFCSSKKSIYRSFHVRRWRFLAEGVPDWLIHEQETDFWGVALKVVHRHRLQFLSRVGLSGERIFSTTASILERPTTVLDHLKMVRSMDETLGFYFKTQIEIYEDKVGVFSHQKWSKFTMLRAK